MKKEKQKDRYRTILKQAFLFFPGTFFLYHYSAWLTWSVLGSTPFYMPIMLMFFVSAFFCLIGLGDIRNPKHLSIPTSALFVGILMGLIGWFFAIQMDPNGYSLWFFPPALVSAFLAKFWADGTERE